MTKNISIVVLALMLIISCAGQKGEVLGPKEFKTKITPDVTLLDVRTTGEYQTGHLDKAVNIDVTGSEFESQCEKLDKSKPVLVYCKAGVRSARAANILRGKGYKVTELKGGIDAWQGDGLPVVK